jgi:hypothetical protein
MIKVFRKNDLSEVSLKEYQSFIARQLRNECKERVGEKYILEINGKRVNPENIRF